MDFFQHPRQMQKDCSRLRARELGPLGPWVAMDLAVGLRQVSTRKKSNMEPQQKSSTHQLCQFFFWEVFFLPGKWGSGKLR